MSKLPDEVIKRLRNRLYGVLCEREKKGQWEKFLNSIIIELMGVPEENKTLYYYVLMSKLNSCRFLDYEYFRTTVLECLSLFDRL